MHSQICPSTGATDSELSAEHPAAGTEQSETASVDRGPICPCCGTHVEVVNTSEAVCPTCDVVVSTEPVSTAPRPRYDDSGERSNRRSGSRLTFLYADRGLGVGIDENATSDESGTPLSETQKRVAREKGWTKHLSSRGFRLDYALGEIRRIGSELEVPETELEEAGRLYRKAHDDGHVTGRSADGFVSACLLVAIRQSTLRIPVSQREIEQTTHATRDQFRTARGVLEVHMGLEVPPMDPRDFLPRAVSMLAAPSRIERRAIKLLDGFIHDDDACQSISPRTLAGAAIHAAYDIVETEARPTLSEISEALDVAVSTISERKGTLIAYRETQ